MIALTTLLAIGEPHLFGGMGCVAEQVAYGIDTPADVDFGSTWCVDSGITRHFADPEKMLKGYAHLANYALLYS